MAKKENAPCGWRAWHGAGGFSSGGRGKSKGAKYFKTASAARRFARAEAAFAAATGTKPPAAVYDAHPALDALTAFIKERVGRPWPRCGRRQWQNWADEQARCILRDLVTEGGAITEAGVSAAELREDIASFRAWRQAERARERCECIAGQRPSVSWPADTPSLRLDALVADLLDDVPPDDPHGRDAWLAIRRCPPPPLAAMRDGAPEWGRRDV